MGELRTGYLLDSHVLLWLLTEPERLADDARRVLADASNNLYVSAASAWEIATKVRLGKLPVADALTMGYERHLRRAGIDTIDISTDHAILGGVASWAHRDPFDRVIAATAIVEGLTLVTADPVFRDFHGLRLLW